MTLQAGTVVGQFAILSPLGAGGMGEVYRSKDTRLGREVALKVLPAAVASDHQRLLRFAQEARSASALNHPNIVTIFEIGQEDELPFIAMELIEGRTLRQMFGSGPLPIKTTLALASQLADGLAKAHEAGIVHRDLKPENVMVTKDGFLKILDFGLAKLVGGLAGGEGAPEAFAQSMTATGFVLGTAGYMSPEQASSKPLDFRSDQFSAGLILYEMLTGRRAFERPTPVETLTAIIREEPEPVERYNTRVPPPVIWILERCLAKDREERYASTRDLARDLKQVRDNLGAFAESIHSRTAAGVAPSAGGPVAPHSRAVTRMSLTSGAPGSPSLSRKLPGAPDAITFVPPAQARSQETPAQAVATRKRRVADFLLVLGLGGLLFAAGAGGGYWFRGKGVEAPATNWRGDLLLGGSAKALAPRVSPDGQTLAFVTILGGVSQVAVMKPSSGDWTVLTRQKGLGSIYKVEWSRDGSKLYFDRVTDVPHGIFSIPAIGGDERLVLEDAQGPEALPDGSLLGIRIDASRNFQPYRFWPDTGRLVPVGVPVVPESLGLSLHAFRDGSAAVFWGKLTSEAQEDHLRHAYLLDLSGGQVSRFSPDIPLSPPVAVAADGRSVLADLVSGDLHRLISVSRDGKEVRVLLTLTSRPFYISAASDGSLYVDALENPADLLRFPATGGVPERIASAGTQVMSPVEFPDGRLVVPSVISGRRRLLTTTAEGSLRPLVDTGEQAQPPVALVDDKSVAFLVGGLKGRPIVAIASIAEGRISKRLESTSGASPVSLVASPDGRTLFYVDAGSIWAVDLAAGVPRKLMNGNGVAVDPRRMELVVQLNEKDGVKLFTTPLVGGPPVAIAFQSPLRVAPAPIAPGCVGPDGRIALTVASPDSWFWGPALLDPTTGSVVKVPLVFEGDVERTRWSRDGSLLATGVALRSSLWRFSPPSSDAVR